MGARREVVSPVTERYRSAKREEKGRILDALCATTGCIASMRCAHSGNTRRLGLMGSRHRKGAGAGADMARRSRMR